MRAAWGLVAFAALAGTVAILHGYPLPPWPLAAALAAWAGMLWVRPQAWLVGLPALVVGLDLSPWTGSTMLGEADLFVLATVATLALRAPPPAASLRMDAGTIAILGLLLAATAVGVARGLGLPGESANPYLRPDNALRLARPVAEAVLLLPFLMARGSDAPRLLGQGLAVALAVVAGEAVIERALFPGIASLGSDYRIAALFGTMRVGGGHIGTFLGMALPVLPMLFVTAAPVGRAGLVGVTGAAGYTLAVTFARTAYGAAAAGLSVTIIAWTLLAPRTIKGGRRTLAALGMAGLLVAGLATVASLGFMRERLGLMGADAATRQANWTRGWEAADTSPAGWLLGRGLGTYARVMLTAPGEAPTDYLLAGDPEGSYLTLKPSTPGFIGQKIAPAFDGPLRLTLRWRAETADATLGVILCHKHLLFSDGCRGATLRATAPGTWQTATVTLPVDGLDAGSLGPLHRPLELALYGSPPGSRVSVRQLSLTGVDGRDFLANGDFAGGMARWGYTDDRHSAWRIFNLYLMTLFETGLLGLAALFGLLAGGSAAAMRLAQRGDPIGAALLGGLAAFAIAGLFDHVMEAPSLVLLLLLVVLSARTGAAA